MVKVLVRGSEMVGVLVCDMCNDLIRDHGLAVALVVGTRRMKQGSVQDVLHVHKGLCLDGARTRLGAGSNPGPIDLADHLSQVVSGADLAAEEAFVDEALEQFTRTAFGNP
jgi:hypothetical protein